MSQNKCDPLTWLFILHQVIFHLNFKKQPYHFRKVKPDDRGRNWLTLSYGECERPSSLGMSSEGLFQTPSDRISHRIHIVRTSCSQLPARSGIFCPLVKVVYWPYGFRFVYQTINLSLPEIFVKLSAKFCWHNLEWFLSPKWRKLFFAAKNWIFYIDISTFQLVQ